MLWYIWRSQTPGKKRKNSLEIPLVNPDNPAGTLQENTNRSCKVAKTVVGGYVCKRSAAGALMTMTTHDG